MSNTPLTAADLLVSRLHALGVRAIFGYPGGQLTPIYDALHRHGGIRHYLARHEQAAAFMADGYARASGQPGVCLAVCGPGVYNAATPMAAAHTDSIPLLVISGQVPTPGLGLRTGYYHENNQLEASTHFTIQQVRIEQPDEIVPGLHLAWTSLLEGRPGPVLLEIPVDVLRGAASESSLSYHPPSLQAPDPQSVAALAQLLGEWRRPLLMVGGGVVTSRAEVELALLAQRLGSPVFHTSNGKCALPASDPLFAGTPWRRATSDLSGMQDEFSPLFQQADGVLAIGCRFTQLATGSWTLKLPALAQIDIDPEEIGRHYPAICGVVGDARVSLQALLALMPTQSRNSWATIPPRGEPWRLPQLDILGPLRRTMPEDAILVADVTRAAYLMMAEFPLEKKRTWLHPSGAVAMGYGVPAALGAKVAHREKKVVAVVGDGGFQMSAMELATSVQEKLPIVVLLINDSCLTLIKATQERRYSGRTIAVDLQNPDFELFAKAFGVDFARVEDDEQLEVALQKAFMADRTSLIEVVLR